MGSAAAAKAGGAGVLPQSGGGGRRMGWLGGDHVSVLDVPVPPLRFQRLLATYSCL